MTNPLKGLLTEHLSDAEKERHRRSMRLVSIVMILLVTTMIIAGGVALMVRG